MKQVAILLAAMLGAVASAAGQGALLVSELMYQPPSGEAEWVELYNPTDTAVELSGFRIVRWVADSMGRHYELPPHTVGPRQWVVLTKDVASVMACYDVRHADRLVECQLPTYPNGGGSVIVCRADSMVVDRLDYQPSMHSRLLRNQAGVSLERRRYDRPTAEASNWTSAASTAGYGTPGYANSQSTETIVLEGAFELSSTTLSPDGDGYQDQLELTYRLPEGELGVEVVAYDGRGRLVRRLLSAAVAGTEGLVAWDGRDESGRVVARGQYVLLITIYDRAGTRQELKRVVAVL